MFHQKKGICKWKSLQAFDLQGFVFLRVPGRTLTHDIQNHKQIAECLKVLVFIGISADFEFRFAAILRLFMQEPILFQ